MAVSFAALLITFVAVMQWWILPAHQQRTEQQASVPQSARDLPLPAVDPLASPTEVTAETNRPESPHSDRQPAASPMSPPAAATVEPPVASTVAPTAAPSADTEAALQRLLREAFEATKDRRWSDASAALRQAAELTDQPAWQAKVDRFATLNDYVQQYWQAFRDGLDGLQGSELVIGPARVFIVSVAADEIVLRASGQNKRYRRDALPTELVMAIADRWFDQRSATTQVFRGAFMLVTPPFTINDVRQAWNRAEQAGVAVQDLIPILDDVRELPPADGS